MTSPAALPTSNSLVVLVLDAGTESGFRLARALLAAGCRVAATDLHAGHLVRIGHGYTSDRLLLLAADTTDADQLERVVSRAHEHFGQLDCAVQSGLAAGGAGPLPLPYMSAA